MGTSVERASANREFYTRGDYVPGIKVDGMDSLAVKEATAWARTYALQHGPLVMEMKTYRYFGHSMSDPDTTYRKRDDIKTVRETRDCILMNKHRLLELGATEDELTAVEDRVRDFVEKQAAEAEAAPPADINLLVDHVFTGEVRGEDGFFINCFFVFFATNQPTH
jgi:pyruvate dehydrogenase E1 component alpha subunit